MRKQLGSSSKPLAGTVGSAVPFGDLLREYRLRAGLSQELLAEGAQLSIDAIGTLERGLRRAPYRSTVTALARALELSESESAALEAARCASRAKPAHSDVAVHLPLQWSSFVGRDDDVAQIAHLLTRARLVTVTGAGGIGKTRAALEAANGPFGAGWDEVWFVDLASLTDGFFIASQIASTVGVPVAGDADAMARLAMALAKRRMLLLLDNCEHLIDAAASTARALLEKCPGVTILATSREKLNIAGEFVYRLQPLLLPENIPERLDEATQYSAIDLFVQRAEAVNPRLTFGAESLPAIVDICRRLDGVPLAIELAAARSSAMDIKTLQAQLRKDFNFSGDRRDLASHQQGVLATIRWSYNLLSDEERQLLCAFSIFIGGFTQEAAEIVCVRESLDAPSIATSLLSLVDKSLVTPAPVEEETRYTLLESVRSFGLDELRRAGKHAELSQRHAQWLADEAWSVRWEKSEAGERFDFTNMHKRDFDNVRAAVVWSLEAGAQDDRALAGRILTGAGEIWSIAGRRSDYRQLLDVALDRIDETLFPEIVARLLHDKCMKSASERGSLATIERAISLFERTGNWEGEAAAHWMAAHCLSRHSMLEEAERHCDRAEQLLREGGVAPELQNNYLTRAFLRLKQGRLDEARADVASAERILAARNQRWQIIRGTYPIAFQIEFAAGNTPLALEIAERMLYSEYGDTSNIAEQALEAVTNFRLLLGDVNAAAESARKLLDRTMAAEGVVIEYPAVVAALRGNPIAAARLFGFVNALVSRTQYHRDPIRQATHELLLSSLREQLVDDAIEKAASEGAQLTAEQVSAEASAALLTGALES